MTVSLVPSRICLPSPLLSARDGGACLFFGSRSWQSSISRANRALSCRSFSGDGSMQEEGNSVNDALLRRILGAKDADQVLDAIAMHRGENLGVVGTDLCCWIIEAALDRNNTELALSVYSAMLSSSFLGSSVASDGQNSVGWKWGVPDVRVYGLLVRGLARSLKVSDALGVIADVSQPGVFSEEEMPFGNIVKCPTCMVPIAVVQPQNGSQVASCSKCRYQYELVSGEIASIDSEELSIKFSPWQKGLKILRLINDDEPAAIHSIVVRVPGGRARTQRFATKTVELPAQEGERVTITLAAATNFFRGPLKFTPRPPQFCPGQPMSLTNHTNGQESALLRVPSDGGNSFLISPSFIFPALALLASGDAASAFIDPTLPRFISAAAITSLAVGATINLAVLPQLNQLPKRTVETIALKQQLLSQYDLVQKRIRDLIQGAEEEVWMLARMCQLENKIVTIGEPSYRARIVRVKSVREGLEESLTRRIQLIESYAKISSMIEIEIEMDSDVLSAEATSNAQERIAEQIKQAMEIENLEEEYRIQAEANDEVEKLLRSQPISTERM
ncbi:pentatricopeptide repeat (PPR) superfamily protein [Wolffia australiana]